MGFTDLIDEYLELKADYDDHKLSELKKTVSEQAAELSKLKEQLAKANEVSHDFMKLSEETTQDRSKLLDKYIALTGKYDQLKQQHSDIRREAILEAVEWYKNNFPYCEDDIYTFEKLIEYPTNIGE